MRLLAKLLFKQEASFFYAFLNYFVKRLSTGYILLVLE